MDESENSLAIVSLPSFDAVRSAGQRFVHPNCFNFAESTSFIRPLEIDVRILCFSFFFLFFFFFGEESVFSLVARSGEKIERDLFIREVWQMEKNL